jgi:hypothetical protein
MPLVVQTVREQLYAVASSYGEDSFVHAPVLPVVLIFIQLSFASLSARKDYEAVVEFFKDKDTSKYNLSLAQAEDGIRARAGMVERSSGELWEWLRNM